MYHSIIVADPKQVRYIVQPMSEIMYRVSSRSAPNIMHYTWLTDKGWGSGCDCEGFKFRKSCSHLYAAAAAYAKIAKVA